MTRWALAVVVAAMLAALGGCFALTVSGGYAGANASVTLDFRAKAESNAPTVNAAPVAGAVTGGE